MINKHWLIELLKTEVLPTAGCTEPGAVALATAYASEIITGEIDKIEVVVNPNVYKNGTAVGIPGTGETGLHIAAALGAVKKNPEMQLLVLEQIDEFELAIARQLVARGVVTISVDETKQYLWIRARVFSGTNWAEAVIQDKHTNLISLQHNGNDVFNSTDITDLEQPDHRSLLRESGITIAGLIREVEKLPIEDLGFLFDGVMMNIEAANKGIVNRLGMGIGATLDKLIVNGAIADDVINYAKKITAAAADARMSGENIKVMSSAGSGNHGITVILPVYAVALKMDIPKERLIRAIAISHLITIYVKNATGNLSALCGCAVAAATGASAAISWMMGGSIEVIESAMKNVIGNLTGMICDGGKVGCALKLSTAAGVAVEDSLLAQQHVVVPSTNGIIDESIESTIENLGKVSNPGMLETDKVILGVMMSKIC